MISYRMVSHCLCILKFITKCRKFIESDPGSLGTSNKKLSSKPFQIDKFFHEIMQGSISNHLISYNMNI